MSEFEKWFNGEDMPIDINLLHTDKGFILKRYVTPILKEGARFAWSYQQEQVDTLKEQLEFLSNQKLYSRRKLEAQLEEANEVIGFYADEWSSWDIVSGACINSSDHEITESNRNCGGKRAREYQQKYGVSDEQRKCK